MAANYEVGNIELNIKSTASESIKAFQSIIDKVKELEDSLGDVGESLKGVTSSTKDMDKKFSKASKEVGNLDKEVEKVGKTSEKTGDTLKKALTFGTALVLAKKLGQMIKSGVDESAGLIQNYRLLQISSKEYFDQALDFQSKMSSSFGVNTKDAMGTQGYFATLVSSLGIANQEANLMSETLTKLSYDMGSLFGEEADSMAEKIKGAIIGQTKPLRSLGVDVTQQTIQGYLDGMGLDVLVQDLNQAEKVLLRYIAIIDQSQISHGNLANSIEMPAQQMQVLKAQVRELGMWLWNVFIGTIGKILPYINAFVMALKEMMKAIALLFGFSLDSYSFGADQMNNATIGADNLGGAVSNIGGQADKTTKKLKKMMGVFGFDEINNVQTPSEPIEPSGGSGGGGVGGGLGGAGVYDDLLGKLSEYDNLMGNVQMKAVDIRNKLLDWLGFLYDINEETGELMNLKWGGFSEMATAAQLISIALAGIAGYKIWGILSKLFSSAGFAKLAYETEFWATVIGDLVGKFFAFEWLTAFVSGFSLEGIISSFGAFAGVLLAPLAFLIDLGLAFIDLGVFMVTGILTPLETLGTLSQVVSGVISTVFASPIAVFALVIATIGAIVVAIKQLWGESEEFRGAWLNVWDGIKDSVDKFKQFFTPFYETIKTYLKFLVTDGLVPLWDGFKELVKIVGIAIADLLSSMKPFIDFFVQVFGGTIGLILVATIGGFIELASSIGRTLGNLFRNIGQIVGGIINIFSGIITFITGVFTGDWDKAWEGVKKIFSGMWNSLIGIVKFVWNTIIGMFSAGGSIFKGIAGSILNVFKTVTNGLIRGINTVIGAPFNALNRLLDTMRSISILGAKPFNWLPRIYVPRIPSFKEGGFPDGENGMFYANDSEMIGKFSNGKTVVANNNQIVDGVSQGVEAGVSRALAQSMTQGSGGDVNVYLDSRMIAKQQKRRELELEMVRG